MYNSQCSWGGPYKANIYLEYVAHMFTGEKNSKTQKEGEKPGIEKWHPTTTHKTLYRSNFLAERTQPSSRYTYFSAVERLTPE